MRKLVLLGILGLTSTVVAGDPVGIVRREPLANARHVFETTGKGRVAFLGGSITQMEGWRVKVMADLQKRFPQTTFDFVCAGLSSTCSDTGAYRLGEHVYGRGTPDLIFVEYAVNDSGDGYYLRGRHDPATYDSHALRGVEGVIRQIRARDPRTDIVMTFFVTGGQMMELRAGQTPKAYGIDGRVAQRYNVTTVSVGEALVAAEKDGTFDWTRYGADCHPHEEGCDFVFGLYRKLFDAEWNAETPVAKSRKRIPVPEAIDSFNYSRAFFLGLDKVALGQGWSVASVDWTGTPGVCRPAYRDGAMLVSDKVGATCSFGFKGTAVGAFVLAGPDCGSLEVSIDGGEFVRYELFSPYSKGEKGLHYPFVETFADGLDDATHTVVLRIGADRNVDSTGNWVRIYRLCVNGTDATGQARCSREGGTLTLGPGDSGTEKEPRVIEGKTFSGAVRLDGWTDDGDGVWSCPAAEWAEELWVNGRRAVRCVWPKGGAFAAVAGGAQTVVSSNAAGVVCRDICRFADAKVAAMLKTIAKEDLPYVHLNVRNAWAFTTEGLTGVDCSLPTQSVVMTGTQIWTDWRPWSKQGCLATFENVRSAFTEKGEWFFDHPAGRIRYRPLDGERLETLSAQVPTRGLRRVVRIEGDPDCGRLVHDIVFRNCTFECSDTMDQGGNAAGLSQQYQYQAAVDNDGLVHVVGAERIRFEGCTFRHSGNHGLKLDDGTSFVTVTNCTFTDLGAGGVWAGARKGYVAKGETLSRRKITTYAPRSVHHIVIDDCMLKGLGRVNPEGCGVVLGHCSDSTVTHCEITDLYYTGVSVGWTWGWKGSVAQRNTISFNHIHDYGQGRLADMGGVYLLGTSFGTCVSNNVIHGVRCTRYGGWGLYTDQSSEGIVLENNLVYDTDDASYSQHYGVGNHVRNNVFAWNRRDGALRCERLEAEGLPNTFMFYNNIILTRDSPIMHQDHWPVDCLHANNVYWDAVRGTAAEFNGNSDEKLDFAAWQRKANDRGSVLADPLFVDAAANDFTLRPDSPALKLGFRVFDMSRAGRRRDCRVVRLQD